MRLSPPPPGEHTAALQNTEDLQHNQLIGGSLRIVNPFLALAMQVG